MAKLISLYKKLLKNYEKFEKGNADALKENIELYKAIPKEKIRSELKSAFNETLEECNHVLSLVASSHLNYAFSKQSSLAREEANVLLDSANSCYHYIVDAVSKISPVSLSITLAKQNLEANFYIHKIKFLKAEMDLFFIKKQLDTEYDPEAMASDLNNIITSYLEFQKIIEKSYRKQYQEQLDISPEFMEQIRTELKEARTLLAKLTKRKKPSETSVFEKQIPLSQDDTTSKPTSSRKKRKEDVTTANNPTPEQDTTRTETPITTTPRESSITPPQPSFTPMDTSGLDVLSAAAIGFFSSPSIAHPPELRSSNTTPFIASQSKEVFWALSPHTKDSVQAIRRLREWQTAQFCNESIFSKQEQKAIAFEKLGESLLAAAISVQESSETMHPVLRLGLLFLLKSAELSNRNFNPSYTIQELSVRYIELLEHFSDLLERKSDTSQCLSQLGKLARKGETLINLSHVTEEEAVNNLFASLAKNCSEEDYQKITEVFFDAFEQATAKISTQLI